MTLTTFGDRGAQRNSLLVTCIVVMFCCVAVEGVFLLFATLGWGLDLPALIGAIYLAWFALFLVTFVYFKWPAAALAVSWLFLFLVGAADWRYGRNRSAAGGLYFYGVPFGYVVASHLGYLLALRKPRAESPASLP